MGCLAGSGALIGLVLIVALITILRGKPEVVPISDQTAHEIPQTDRVASSASEPLRVGEVPAGVVVLDVREADFSIVRADPGTPLRLEAHYDSGAYELEERFDPSGELGWTYRLTFGKRSMWDFFRADPDNRLEVHLPAGTPIVLEGEVGIGATRLELGGLWIESLDLSIGVGDHQISFDEPLATPMEKFAVRGSIGELRIRSLGNASPATALVRHSIGELDVGLAGAWRNDAEVSVRSSIGECRVRLPDPGIQFELIGAPATIGESNTRRTRGRERAPEGTPVVRLEAQQRIGELRLTE